MTWKHGLFVGALLISAISTHARLGESEKELIKRFGPPAGRSQHSIIAQGKIRALGPTLAFRQDDWSISCDLVDGRCVRIGYSKRGDWSEEQVQLVLNSNAQGAKWTETSRPTLAKLQRTWLRADGSTATWTAGGMTLIWDAYNKAKAVVEEQARVEAMRKPKI